MKWKKIMLFSFFILSILFSMSSVQSIPLFDSDDVVFGVGNQNYTLTSSTESIDRVYVADSWIRFNTTDFNITSTNPINLTLSYLDDNILTASAGDTVLSFSADSSGGLVYFNLSGFDANQSYEVYRDNSKIQGLTSDADGVISWTNTVWSDHDFDIKEGGNYVQVTYGRSALAEITPMGYDVLGMVGLIGIVLVGAAIILYVTRMGSDF